MLWLAGVLSAVDARLLPEVSTPTTHTTQGGGGHLEASYELTFHLVEQQQQQQHHSVKRQGADGEQQAPAPKAHGKR
jgi:hypothetical protein